MAARMLAPLLCVILFARFISFMTTTTFTLPPLPSLPSLPSMPSMPSLFTESSMPGSRLETNDSYNIKKCMCASDTRIGYHVTYYVNVLSLNFTGMVAWKLGSTSRRDHESGFDIAGYLCNPGSSTMCKRLPDAKDYFTKSQIVNWADPKRDCIILEGTNVCLGVMMLAVNGTAKMLPWGQGSKINNNGCAEDCAMLWPGDSSTFPLCERTELSGTSKFYLGRVMSGTGYTDSVDRCWRTEISGWNWHGLKRF